MGLYEGADKVREESLPLSKRMMPADINEFEGQRHLLGKGKPIATMIENGMIHSMIFYGPPATGKTSLAWILSQALEYRFVSTNALTLDTEAIRTILKEAEHHIQLGQKTVVFIDEIHRLNKPKQDAFLSSLENGIITMIGATTENPYFIMQPALRSRLFIYEFKPHTRQEMELILDRAIKNDKFLAELEIKFEDKAKDALLESAKDPRMLLNTLEITILSKGIGESFSLTVEDISNILQRPDTLYSSKEGHYDVVSAFIKSVRGSDPDAALYYLAVMMESGEDPLFIARRLIILAAEDIGLAYPEALPHATACYTALEKIGMPEGRLVLAETTILLAGVPKSNSATTAIGKAQADVKSGKIMPVPQYLRDAHFKGAKNLGRGVDYQYPHSFPRHFVAQKYTDEPVHYYDAGELGFEKRIKEWMDILHRDKKD